MFLTGQHALPWKRPPMKALRFINHLLLAGSGLVAFQKKDNLPLRGQHWTCYYYYQRV